MDFYDLKIKEERVGKGRLGKFGELLIGWPVGWGIETGGEW